MNKYIYIRVLHENVNRAIMLHKVESLETFIANSLKLKEKLAQPPKMRKVLCILVYIFCSKIYF